jgi:cell division protein ZapA (FtsZ GTPase activity inhibitor)
MAINIPIISSLDSKGFEKAALEFKGLETNSQKAGFVMEKAFLPAVAALAGLAAAAAFGVKAAVEDEAAQMRLAKALQNVTGATDGQIAAVEASIKAMSRATGVSDDELRPAFASLTRGTKNLADANEALGLAMDISAATGQDLQGVSDALALAYGGNTKALAKLSPELKVAIKEGASLDQVMGMLTKTFGGSAAAAANTAEGQFRKFNVAIKDAKEAIGVALMPAVEAILPLLISFGDWASEHTGIITALGVAIAAVASAIVAYKTAQVLANAVTVVATALNFANAASLAAVATAGTAGVAAATIAAGLVAVGAAMLIFKNQNKAAAVATTQLTTTTKTYTGALQQQNGEFSREFAARVKGITAMDEFAKKQEALTKSTGSASDKIEKMKQNTLEAAKALREYMGAALDDAKAKLDKAQSAFDSFSGSVAQVITEALNFGKAFEEGGEDAGTTFFSALQKQADKTKEFGDLVEQLLAAGLSQDALQQVIDAGIDSGSAIAKELLTSSENVLRANTLVEQTQAIAQRIGELSAQKFYGAGVSNAKAYLRGVEEALAAAEGRLSRKGINFADVKGISTSFTEAISAPSVSPVVMPNIDELNARRGGGAVTINVNSQLATKSEVGQAVTDALRAYNRTAGPAQFEIA